MGGAGSERRVGTTGGNNEAWEGKERVQQTHPAWGILCLNLLPVPFQAEKSLHLRLGHF